MMSFHWNEENIEQLRRLDKAGLSAGQIAARLGEGVSRSAVIGKLNRVRAGRGRPMAGAVETELLGRIEQRLERKRELEAAGEDVSYYTLKNSPVWNALEGSNPVRLELHDGCKWPIGVDGVTHFCNEAVAPGRVYCAAHYAVAYRAPNEYEVKLLKPKKVRGVE